MKRSFLSFLLLLFIPCFIFAQSFILEKQVVGTGGFVSQTNSTGFELSGIMGQTAIEIVRSNSSNYDLHQGFWVWAEEDFVAVEDNSKELASLTNYPNPFNNSTTISYMLESPSYVTVKIYDMHGSLVKTLISDQFQSAGYRQLVWDGREGRGIDAASGSYIYELVASPLTMTGSASNGSLRVKNIMILSR